MRKLGKYLLVEPIASGGMAEVWRAEVAGPSGFVKQVAVKLIRADRGGDEALGRMFVQEARLASRLNHANIVQVHDFDVVDGVPLMAMELVHSRTLREVLDRCREQNVRFGLPRAVHVAEQVARALAYAHRPVEEGGVAGLVHRDVSPSNILVSFEGEVKLTDFGVARLTGSSTLTGTGTLKGKIGYMAPEQASEGSVDARADIFALGVVLWETCTGQRLFARDSDVATLRALTGDDPIRPPSFWNESVPPELDELVMAALERDPSRRIASADEMARRLAEIELAISRTPEDRDLRPLMRRLWPGEVPVLPGASGQPAADGAPAGPGTAATESWPPRRGWRRFLVAAVVLLAAASGAIALGVWVGSRGAPSLPASTGAAATLPASPAATSPAAGPTTGGPPTAAIPATTPATTDAAPPAGRVEAPSGPAPARGKRVASAPDGAVPAVTAPAGARRDPAPRGAPPAGVRATAGALEGLPLPTAASGEGILFVNAVPWAEVVLDGKPEGETPREYRLAAGAHRVRLVHPTRGTVDRDVEVRPGQRTRVEIPLGP